ncbi:MAG: sigma-54 dependent transcriptional regulator [Rikenellaceae bacterium]
MNKILILEPSKSVRKGLCELMELEGFAVSGVESVEAGEKVVVAAMASKSSFDLMLFSGELATLSGALSSLPFIVISSEPSIDEALQVAKKGALDYMARPFDMNRLLSSVRGAIAATNMEEHTTDEVLRNDSTNTKRTTRRVKSNRGADCCQMVGASQQMVKMRDIIDKVAPTDARVMILGENGTGKELVARSLHNKSNRANAPFIEVNCAAIPSELIESELFGHEKGAFTSACKQRKGKFEQAQGGTIFLDEIGDMSLSAQAKVLRALQERKITRVGSDSDIDVDVRVIAATNKDMGAAIAAGEFREDLFHRIGVILIRVAPLRERAEDIPLLIEYFLKAVCQEYRSECKEISTEALTLLSQMSWSGNIRELRNVVERLVVLCDKRIEAHDVELYCTAI